MPASTELDRDEAVRLVVRALGALVAFVLAAGVAIVLRDAGGGDQVVAEADGEPLLAAGPPPAGTDVPGYVVRRRVVLDRLDGRLVAVVSFDRYATETDARRLVDGVKVRALLAAAPGGSPSVATGGLRQWADQQQAEAEVERANLDRMARETEDPAFVAQFQADQARLTALIERIDPTGPVVYGAVVEADVSDLRAVAGRPGVRLVDPMARRAGDDDLTAFGGVRPEETGRTDDPPHRPL